MSDTPTLQAGWQCDKCGIVLSEKYDGRCVPVCDGLLQPVFAPSNCSPARWSARFIFAWYDLWFGIFWDSRKRRLYIMPLPCVGVMFEFPRPGNGPDQR